MSDISPRRRWAGHTLVAAGALALPLTASFTYAAQAQIAPVAPVLPAQPAPPEAIAPPAPPASPEGVEHRVERYVVTRDADGKRVRSERGDGDRVVRHVIIRRDGDGIALADPHVEFRGFDGAMDPEYRAKLEDWSRAMDAWSSKYGTKWGRDMGAWGKRFGAQQALRGERMRVEGLALAERMRNMPEFAMNCDGKEGANETTLPNGPRQVVICHHAMRGQALSGLQGARDRIANDSHLSEDVRRDVLQDLDGEIERLKNDGEK